MKKLSMKTVHVRVFITEWSVFSG